MPTPSPLTRLLARKGDGAGRHAKGDHVAEKRTRQLKLNMRLSRTKDEHARRTESSREIHGEVQAGGHQAGQRGAGSVGKSTCAGGAQADAEQVGSAGRQGALQGAGERPLNAEQMELARLLSE